MTAANHLWSLNPNDYQAVAQRVAESNNTSSNENPNRIEVVSENNEIQRIEEATEPTEPAPAEPTTVSETGPSTSNESGSSMSSTSSSYESPNADSTLSQNAGTNAGTVNHVIDLTNNPSPPKKRMRTSKKMERATSTPNNANSTFQQTDTDEDDGYTCPICFEKWEITGDHRLISLRCGHLFGESCIRRWLNECQRQSGVKLCPQCKTKTTVRDIRHLFAKRVRVVDRSEEEKLRKALEEKTIKILALEMEVDVLKMQKTSTNQRVQSLETENAHLRLSLSNRPLTRSASTISNTFFDGALESSQPLKNYKLFMEKNIALSDEQSCRVMIHSHKRSRLYVSQKSENQLFACYGIREIDTCNFRVRSFRHLTNKEPRDFTLDAAENMLVCTSQETSAKLYDFRTPNTANIGPFGDNQNLWACTFGNQSNENSLYFGQQQGGTTVVDIRYPTAKLFEIRCADLSPAFSIVAIPPDEEFPMGGICVGKLQSIWFYENASNESVTVPSRLDIDGPFLDMCYEPTQRLLVLTTRKCTRYPESRLIVGTIRKSDNHAIFSPQKDFIGAHNTPIMTRACQIAVPSNILLAAYMQDSKQLALFDIKRQTRLQSLSVSEIIFDTCPIYKGRDTYVAALTAQKCRIYKLNEV